MGLFKKPDMKKLRQEKNLKGLIKALKYTKDADIQQDAAAALGHMKDTKAIDALIKVLKNKNYEDRVREAAGHSLGMIGDTQAVEPLIQILQDKDGIISRQMYLDGLGMIKDDRVIDYLVQVLREKDDSTDQTRAATALFKFGKIAIGPLIQVLKDETAAGAQNAVIALRNIGGDEAMEGIKQAFDHPDFKVRAKAAEAIGDIGGSKAEETLKKALQDESDFVKMYARKALTKLNARDKTK